MKEESLVNSAGVKTEVTTIELTEQIALLPPLPGVYRFLDKDGTIIYVGKAKNLKKRVSSYFNSTHTKGRKTVQLVKNIKNILHIVVESEYDALLLENNLIKQYQPKYNILLKDDKSYPWIVVRNEPYPRVMQTRQLVKDGSLYFGPYASVTMQRNILEVVHKIYSIRSCNLRLTPEGIKKHKFDKCLEYHLGNCKAPCEDYISQEEYKESVDGAVKILKGNTQTAFDYLKDQMAKFASELKFEKAQKVKNKIALLENYRSKSLIVSPTLTNLDIFTLLGDGNSYYCNYMHVSSGAITGSFSIELKTVIDESEKEVLTYAISQIMEVTGRELSHNVLVPFMPDVEYFKNCEFTTPQRGDKLKLMELSEKNCRIFMLEKLKHIEKTDPARHTNRIMKNMQQELFLDKEPRHIECFDNSNFQGTDAVSACVVFRDGKPAKKDYRHFNIKTVVGIDDFASMYETLIRRYSRMVEEKTPLPDLVVVDGGKGQLSSAYRVLCELGIEHQVPIIGLAKRLEEVFYPFDSTPHYLDKTSDTLKVLMHIRNEAHRFGITFHRNKRSKSFIKSEFDSIGGVGARTIEALMAKFKTVSAVKKATVEMLQQVTDRAKAQKIYNHFHPEENSDKLSEK